MNRQALTYLKGAAAVLFVLIAYGLAGSDDYAEAVAQEQFRKEIGR